MSGGTVEDRPTHGHGGATVPRRPRPALHTTKKAAMTRFLSAIAHALRGPGAGDAVHFHKGPGQQPEVCYDAHCPRPRLDPEA